MPPRGSPCQGAGSRRAVGNPDSVTGPQNPRGSMRRSQEQGYRPQGAGHLRSAVRLRPRIQVPLIGGSSDQVDGACEAGAVCAQLALVERRARSSGRGSVDREEKSSGWMTSLLSGVRIVDWSEDVDSMVTDVGGGDGVGPIAHGGGDHVGREPPVLITPGQADDRVYGSFRLADGLGRGELRVTSIPEGRRLLTGSISAPEPGVSIALTS
jgi:hypothetical protein